MSVASTVDGIPLDPDTPFRVPRWMKAAIAAVLVLAIGAVAFAVFQPIKVLPRIRLAPGYAMVDQAGRTFTSEDARGAITLYTFVPLDCGESCDAVSQVDRTMEAVRSRVPAEIPLGAGGTADGASDGVSVRYVTVVVDPAASVADLVAAAGRAGADGDEWRFVSGDERTLDTAVGLGFGRHVEAAAFVPSYVIVDGWGTIRGEYRYETLADRADTLVRHIGILVGEIRHSSGIASLAYGAAHVFMCYP